MKHPVTEAIKWQSMDSVPKDGDEFLALIKGTRSHWTDAYKSKETPDLETIAHCRWESESETFQDDDFYFYGPDFVSLGGGEHPASLIAWADVSGVRYE